MAEAQIHPPSHARIAEARAAGFAPRPLLLGLSVGAFALALCVRHFGASIAEKLVRLLRAPLLSFARGEGERALSRSVSLLAELASELALCASAVLTCVVIGSLLAQGPGLGFPAQRRLQFPPPKLSLEASLLAVLAIPTLCAFHLLDALWLEPSSFPALVARFLFQLAGLLLGLLLIDTAFARAQFFRALWLTRSELRREQREAYGAPELRLARESARRELTEDAR